GSAVEFARRAVVVAAGGDWVRLTVDARQTLARARRAAGGAARGRRGGPRPTRRAPNARTGWLPPPRRPRGSRWPHTLPASNRTRRHKMDDSQVMGRIDELVAEEQRLFEREGRGDLEPGDHARLD